MGTVENPGPKAGPRSRIAVLLVVFNVILLGSLLYKTFGRALTPSGGVSVSLTNGLLTPMVDLRLEYPGGKLELPRINPGERVGHSIANVKGFDAILTFKDEAGHAFRETISVQPLDEFLILIEVLPVLEESTLTTADGAEVEVIKASTSKVRVITAYQAPVSYN
ncbi:hypothetical protein P12x_005863 [Tundrisphaera lichenicola]|uniref:hypothetical protein n=1 Tax=Tundrisphaera lichenicola TaxID=2029860 RepID=UPI003EBCC6AE